MAKDIHEVLGGVQEQSSAESIVYSIDTAPWGGTPSAPAVDVFDEEDFATSVKSTVMPTGSPTVLVNDVFLPPVTALTEGKIYRVYVTFVSGGNTLRAYIRIKAKA